MGILNNVKEIHFNNLYLESGYHFNTESHLKYNIVARLCSLEKCRITLGYDYDRNNGKRYDRFLDVTTMLISQNLDTLKHIEFICHEADNGKYDIWDCEDLFLPLSQILKQCVSRPEWTLNVLESINLELNDIMLLSKLVRSSVMKSCYDLAMLLKRNNVSFLFKAYYKKSNERTEEEDIEDENHHLSLLKIQFGCWKYEDVNDTKIFTLNNQIVGKQRLIDDYFRK